MIVPAGQTKYISRGEWFDVDTEAVLVDDYRVETHGKLNSGLFRGYRNGKSDEEICPFDEFVAMVIE